MSEISINQAIMLQVYQQVEITRFGFTGIFFPLILYGIDIQNELGFADPKQTEASCHARFDFKLHWQAQNKRVGLIFRKTGSQPVSLRGELGDVCPCEKLLQTMSR